MTDIKQAVRELSEALRLHAVPNDGPATRLMRLAVACEEHLPAVLDRLEKAYDCGEDGACGFSPGCNRHWEERNRELVRENAELTNARNYYEEVWKDSCAHVGEACKILGVDPKKTPADTWTLREAALRVVAERDAAIAKLQQTETECELGWEGGVRDECEGCEVSADDLVKEWRTGDRQRVVTFLLSQSGARVAFETANLCLKIGPTETRELAFELAGRE